MDKFKSRKLWFFTMLFIVGTWLLVKNHIQPDQWKELVWACAIAFSGGNVGEHFANKKKGDG